MGTQDARKNGSGTITGLTRYGLGARGIDVVSRTTSSGNTVSYPLYDAHGNNVGALCKSGSSFVVSDEKSYDAWGGLRSGTNANGKAAYCANLGHKQDDESGLIYMRARYYEPTSGRFISEDAAHDGMNWFEYAGGDPVNRCDANGNETTFSDVMFKVGQFLTLLAMMESRTRFGKEGDYGFARDLSSAAAMCFGMAWTFAGNTNPTRDMIVKAASIMYGTIRFFAAVIGRITEGARCGSKSRAQLAVMATFAYSLAILGLLASMECDSEGL